MPAIIAIGECPKNRGHGPLLHPFCTTSYNPINIIARFF